MPTNNSHWLPRVCRQTWLLSPSLPALKASSVCLSLSLSLSPAGSRLCALNCVCLLFVLTHSGSPSARLTWSPPPSDFLPPSAHWSHGRAHSCIRPPSSPSKCQPSASARAAKIPPRKLVLHHSSIYLSMGPEVDRLQISEALSWRPKWHWVSSGSLIGKAKYISRLILEGEREREREKERHEGRYGAAFGLYSWRRSADATWCHIIIIWAPLVSKQSLWRQLAKWGRSHFQAWAEQIRESGTFWLSRQEQSVSPRRAARARRLACVSLSLSPSHPLTVCRGRRCSVLSSHAYAAHASRPLAFSSHAPT